MLQQLSLARRTFRRWACLFALIFFATACPTQPPQDPSTGAGTSAPRSSESLVWKFERDPSGRITKTIDPAGRAFGVAYELHPNGRVRRVVRTFPDDSRATHDFDTVGRPVESRRDEQVVTYGYDSQGRLASVKRSGLVEGASFEYDTLDRLVSETIGNKAVKLQYDILGRLKAMTTPVGQVTYEYSPGQRLVVRTLPGGQKTAWKYDARGRLHTIEHSNARKELIARYTYEWRPDGRLLKATDTSPVAEKSITYDYDGMGELTKAEDAAGRKAEFKYDLFGNRTFASRANGPDMVATYDFAARLSSLAGKPCQNDPTGSLVACEGRDIRYTHGLEGTLGRVVRGGVTVDYEYDASGAMVSRSVGGQKTSFFPDPVADAWRPMLAKGAGGGETLYLWEENTLLGEIRDGKPRFFLHDQLGSVRLVVDGGGSVIAERDYEPFGAPTKNEADLEPGFGGLFYDPAAGLYLTKKRAYDPELGRFLERDPELRAPGASAEDLSAYAYCANDPLNAVDLTGEKKSDPAYHETHRNVYYVTVPKVDFSQSGLEKTPGYNGGRGGNEFTRLQNYLIADDLAKQGFKITNMIGWHDDAKGAYKELYLPPIPGHDIATKGNYIDIVATKGDTTLFISTQSTDPAGQARETAQDFSVISKLMDHGVFRDHIQLPSWPSDVGGVALTGAGTALSGLGELQGVALDENHRIVLLAKDKSSTHLPPMHLDDVVTVFRAVYERGQSPLVSIDPDPKSPQGSQFVVRYGEGTEGTYVGWVLFEADRRMKTYSMGKDNLTSKGISSKVSGYRSVPDMLADTRVTTGSAAGGNPVWERFWIVPASRTEKLSANGTLSLFDVPLRVNTQVMKLAGGKLEAAPNDPPSAAASRFAAWFTEHYDALDVDAPSKLPAGHSRPYDTVDVFAELRRIALLTAVAERLRGDGVPLPSWMMHHRVQSFPAPNTTPRIEVVQVSGNVSHRVAGGVSLATAKSTVNQSKSPEADAVLKSVASSLAAGGIAAGGLAAGNPSNVTRAVALPGAGTRDVGALVIQESDLVVPLSNGDSLALTRKWSSFFDPSGELGRGWTLDLPALVAQWDSVSEGDRVKRTQVSLLTSPLQTVSARFIKIGEVPELGAGKLFLPAEQGGAIALGSLQEGESVWMRDGRQLLFNANGQLIRQSDGERALRFRWDGKRRLVSIESGRGGQASASIRLDYDASERLVSATSSGGVVVRYSYDREGYLQGVDAPGRTLRYGYSDGRLVDASNGKTSIRHTEYDSSGRVARDVVDGKEKKFTYSASAAGVEVTTELSTGIHEVARHDPSMRPLEEKLASGAALKWEYPSSDAVRASATLPDGTRWTMVGTADRRRTSWTGPAGTQWTVKRDLFGRVVDIQSRDARAGQFAWLPTGQLQTAVFETSALTPAYGKDGAMTGFMVHAPTKGPTAEWFKVEWSDAQQATEIRDPRGFHAVSRTDAAGRLKSLDWNGDRVDIRRDESGRVTSLQTTWGQSETRTYGAGDTLAKVERIEDGRTLTVDYDAGRPSRVRSFDGSEMRLAYGPGPTSAVSRLELPNGVAVAYHHDESGRLTEVACGGRYRIHYTLDSSGRPTSVMVDTVQ